MDSDQLESIERELARAVPAPVELRGEVMRSVRRRLAGERWGRRVGRFAGAVLLIGIALNWSVGWGDRDWRSSPGQVAARPSSQSIVEFAVAIGQATDAETGSRMAQHLAALSGATISPEQASAIERASQRRTKSTENGRKEGSS